MLLVSSWVLKILWPALRISFLTSFIVGAVYHFCAGGIAGVCASVRILYTFTGGRVVRAFSVVFIGLGFGMLRALLRGRALRFAAW